jgi:outer membrane receptor protein involved in Fe transport
LLYRKVGNDTVEFKFSEKLSKDFTPRIALNYKFNDDFNVRLIYPQAFRAVPPQEMIRLPATFTGQAESEKTYDYEAIINYNPLKELNLQLSAFYLKGNVVYQWNPAEMAFSKGSGWNNTGASFSANYIKDNLELWFNTTYYLLKRSSDAYAFMKDYKVTPKVPLPNMEKALDSPTLLAKFGGSYSLPSQTIFGLEFYYNNEILILTPTDLNVGDPIPAAAGQPNYKEYKVPASYYLNLTITQKFAFINMDNLSLQLKVRNLLDSEVWNVLNMDMQGFDKNTYYRPNQIPDFGRRITLQMTYEF